MRRQIVLCSIRTGVTVGHPVRLRRAICSSHASGSAGKTGEMLACGGSGELPEVEEVVVKGGREMLSDCAESAAGGESKLQVDNSLMRGE